LQLTHRWTKSDKLCGPWISIVHPQDYYMCWGSIGRVADRPSSTNHMTNPANSSEYPQLSTCQVATGGGSSRFLFEPDSLPQPVESTDIRPFYCDSFHCFITPIVSIIITTRVYYFALRVDFSLFIRILFPSSAQSVRTPSCMFHRFYPSQPASSLLPALSERLFLPAPRPQGGHPHLSMTALSRSFFL
jgi:hypothetical protein